MANLEAGSRTEAMRWSHPAPQELRLCPLPGTQLLLSWRCNMLCFLPPAVEQQLQEVLRAVHRLLTAAAFTSASSLRAKL